MFEILLVEDDEDHAILIKSALKDEKIASRIHWVIDGETALDYLFHKGQYLDKSSYPTPDLIFLDLRLPKINGLEVLKLIKESKELKDIPVVILTVSENETDIKNGYEYGANSYLVKPVDYSKFCKIVQTAGYYWMVKNQTYTRLVK